MGELVQFLPRARPVQAHNVHVVGVIPNGARIISVGGDIPPGAQVLSSNGISIYYMVEPDRDEYAMDDDNVPSELNPDPFEEDVIG